MENKVYVYKQYYDRYAYGEEKISLYADHESAEIALKNDVEQYYEASWEDIPTVAHLSEDDTFSPDYVSIDTGNGIVFWIIEAHEVHGSKNA